MKKSLSTNQQANVSLWLQVHPTLGVTMMDHLFNKMDAMYPGRWIACYKNETSVQNWRDTWAEAFDDERILPHQVKAGIAQCRKLYDWPPSLTEFLKACTTVVPLMHRDFPPMLTHKMTKEEREAGLKKVRDISEKLFAKVSA
ncbi:hypothetical protein SAMN05216420_101372 [Nitrosospira sp. Nl5]|uniref:replication protein P n=1 Tax=Nitrosospira sp. Nl5 TaxID=200120 RepID=UPI0008922679|nr:replication protein P [Nitrosospira sp. Nl5]SCX93260.1 hypothetical protein SAMN05216420_101372 [Nitrosospira sp. Nl5]